MNIPQELYYSAEHEWVRIDGDNIAVIGITDYAQEQLGDVVFADLPVVGDSFEKGASMASLESVKAVSEVYAPVSGEVSEVNESLSDTPEILNEDPYGKGWIVKIVLSNRTELEELLTPNQYQAYVEEESD